MFPIKLLDELKKRSRTLKRVDPAIHSKDEALGPLALLARNWQSLPGHGWNVIALPFVNPPTNYRLLINQYDETLDFTLVDTKVPNRGIRTNGTTEQTDQFITVVQYIQAVVQLAAADFPVSGEAGGADLPIHHEPGLWMHILNENTDGLDIARLATVPHGDSVLALGRSSGPTAGPPTIPDIGGLPPSGRPQDLSLPYFAPYAHFHDQPFKGNVTDPSFPGFDPIHPNLLLVGVGESLGEVIQTTTLTVDTSLEVGSLAQGGIVNLPFIVKQANATAMRSTFWIQEINPKEEGGPELLLQYSQYVALDFFANVDGQPGQVIWPHVSINSLIPATESSKSRSRFSKILKP